MPNRIPLRDELSDKHAKWSRITALMDNDEDAFREDPFCIRWPNESTAAYKARQKYFAAGFINSTMDLISAPGNSLFRNGVNFRFDNGEGLLAQFADNCTLGNDKMPWLRYVEEMFCPQLRAYGTVFTVIDKPRIPVRSRQDERQKGMPYVSILDPENVVNYEIINGHLQWFAYKRNYRPVWLDPINEDQPAADDVTCVWTPQDFAVFKGNGELVEDQSFSHNWGFVPVVIQSSFVPKPCTLLGVSAFEQTSNMLITANNQFGVALWEMYKHGSAVLLLHDDAMSALNQSVDDDGNTELKKQDKGTALVWTGEHEPRYLVKELAIDDAMKMGMFYAQAAVENERDLKSVRKQAGSESGAIPQSGIAKLVDREPLEANLISLAIDAESYSDKVFNVVSKLLGQDNDMVMEFDKDFDLRTVEQKFKEIELANKQRIKDVMPTGWAEMWHNIVPDITRDVETQEAMNEEIDTAKEDDSDDTAFADDLEERMRRMADGGNQDEDKDGDKDKDADTV